MAIEKGSKWIRSPNFRKYFATGFGLSHAGNMIRLEFSDEKVEFSKKDVANELEFCVDGADVTVKYVDGAKTTEELFPFINENLIKSDMCADGERQSDWCLGDKNLAQYIQSF